MSASAGKMNNDSLVPPPMPTGPPPPSPSPHSRPRRSILVRLLSILGIGLVALLLLAVIAAVFENRRGRRAWMAFKAEQEALGERFEIRDFVPPSVPDDQNFAMTPFLAPLLDYVPGRPVTWNDPAGRERADELGEVFKREGRRSAPASGNWEAGVFVDLDRWAAFFADQGDEAAPAESPTPAATVLAGLARFDPVLEELRLASSRTHSIFPIHYDENFNASLPHLATLKSIAQITRLRALARLSLGRNAEALQDITLALSVGEAVRSEPLIISQLVRIAIHHLALQPVWEGMARKEWNAAQLRDLQIALASVQMLPDYGRALRGERALSNDLFEKLRTGRLDQAQFMDLDDGPLGPEATRFLPNGWFYHNQVVLNRLLQQYALSSVDAQERRVHPGKAALSDDIPELARFSPYNVFARLLLPAVGKTAAKFAKAQTSLDLATVACAVERSQLARGTYPDRLEDLVPEFIADLPNDIISGQPLRYSRTGDGRFAIYSVGWNQSDDGGEPRHSKSGDRTDPNAGDWVWRYPAK